MTQLLNLIRLVQKLLLFIVKNLHPIIYLLQQVNIFNFFLCFILALFFFLNNAFSL